MEWLVNMDLLYSTGHSTQYSVITSMGKESEKESCVMMYNWVTLLYSRYYHNIVNQLDFNKTLKKWKQTNKHTKGLRTKNKNCNGKTPRRKQGQSSLTLILAKLFWIRHQKHKNAYNLIATNQTIRLKNGRGLERQFFQRRQVRHVKST